MENDAAEAFDLDELHARLLGQDQHRADAWDHLKSEPDSILIHGLDSPYTDETRNIAASLGATGFALNRWWVLTPTNWICPACARSKAEFARLTEKGLLFGDIHEHHDHMGDHVRTRFIEAATSKHWPDLTERAMGFANRLAPMISAYDPTLTCADCNAADAKAKKIAGAPAAFSFAPADIAKFTIKQRNQVHRIDGSRAKEVWAEHAPTFALRMKVLDRMIEIALQNQHWFQPSDFRARPDFVEAAAKGSISRFNRHLEADGYPGATVTEYNYVDLMRAARSNGKTSKTWRNHTVQVLGRAVTPHDIRYLETGPSQGQWTAVPEGWHCPCCSRAKLEIIQPSKQFAVSFSIHKRSRTWDGPLKTAMCGECNWTVISVANEAGVDARLVSLQDIRDCVIARPNRSHEVRSAPLVDAVVERIRERQ